MNLAAADNLTYFADGGTAGADENMGDSIYMRACGAAYRIMFLSPAVGNPWFNAGGGVTAEVLNPWEGFWIKRGTGTPAGDNFNWTLPKPYVNPPN